jgi:hypothetical protein
MSKRYRSVLYAYLPCCCCNKDQRKFIVEKNQQAQRFIQVLQAHQKQNSTEKPADDLINIDKQRSSRLKS